MRYVGPGDPPDDEYDALPLEGLEPGPSPVRFRSDNPEYAGAWRALYGVSRPGEVAAARQRRMREHGDGYPAWVLDQIGVETMLANRIALGRGLQPPRFGWTPFADALMYPLSTARLREETPDYRVFYAGEQRLLARYLAAAGRKAPPASLEQYLAEVVTATLEHQKHDGAVALKFEATYLRPLDFGAAGRDDAARVYERYAGGGEPPAAEYKVLQDFLFHYIAREAGRLKLPVHFHTGQGGGAYFHLAGSNPLLLEHVLDDAELRKTSFVLVHGGWPFTKETAFLINRSNVWCDFSNMDLLLYPEAMAEILRGWLEQMPERVMFGTDAFPFDPPLVSWEDSAWLAATSGRRALALALTAMLSAGEITRPRALELARMVLRDNARKLYGLP
jgi:predicted TIM-barrel fold metal-dependent hydrolase